jgi:anti-anti-sigma factor
MHHAGACQRSLRRPAAMCDPVARRPACVVLLLSDRGRVDGESMNTHEIKPPLHCRVMSRGTTAYVAAVGELDIDTAGAVEARLEERRAAGFETIVLDLRETTFIDSTGMHLALGWHDRARSDGFCFALIEGPAAVRRVIDLLGVRAALNFIE